MLKKIVLTFSALFSYLFADSCVLNQRENYFLTSTDYRITPKVNPITGEYCEEEVDLVVAGCEPLSIRRFYNHLAPYEPRYASWRYNPEAFLVANFELDVQDIFAAVGEADGSICSYKSSNNQTFLFEIPKSFACGVSNGQTHPSNTEIHYEKLGDPKDKLRFRYTGIISDGSGRVRRFTSPMHRWNDIVHYTEKRGNIFGGSEKTWRIYPNVWTPYHIPIDEERLPNGNIICYESVQWKKEKRNYPRPELLGKITAYNHDKSKVLGSITFLYPRFHKEEIQGIECEGSDKRKAHIQHTNIDPILLASATRPDQPTISYGYQEGVLHKVEKPDGRVLLTEYQDDKVSAQYALVGPNGEMFPIGRYEYQDNATLVYDAEGHKTIYRYDKDKKITAIETPYYADTFTWDASGSLKRKANPLQITEYQYDKNQNPVFERIGDGKQWRTIKRTFSKDFNLKLTESDREGKEIRYTYVPNTNLLASALVCVDNTICKRTFHFYDDCAICIKTIVDDGASQDPYDLQGVTYRKVTEITPKQSLPCFGLPEIIEEKTIDSSGHEKLISKIVYSYAPSGKVLTEEHFDADNIYRYTIYNTYDEKERLASTTDPLGYTTTFFYDANNNLILIKGPKEHKEIAYDLANRPIHIAEWLSDDTVLITERKYDKLGNLTQEIDPCQNTIHFEYDALGRVITIIHPDGAIERKEYDILGNITKEIDPNGYITRKEYNFACQPIAIYHPDGREEHFTYTETGALATYTAPNGTQTFYTYDPYDHTIRTEVLDKVATAIYSPFHKLSETDPEGVTTTYTYDFAGRLIAKQIGERLTTYAYDSLGNLSQVQEGPVTTTYLYDVKGQLLAKSIGNYFKESYTYDEAGNRTSITTCMGTSQTEYNNRGEPIQHTDPLGHTTHITYSYKDCFTKMTTNPKGVQTHEIHDSHGRLIDFQVKNPEIIQRSEKKYDPSGNLTHSIEYVYEGPTLKRALTREWIYGPCGRVEKQIDGPKVTQYLYDSIGRLKTTIKPDGNQLHREYDTYGRLSSYFTYKYTYDRNDRLIKIEDGKTTTKRTYDIYGNLIEEKLASDITLKSNYDSYGRRTSLKLPDGSKVSYTYRGPYFHTISRGQYTHTYSERNLAGKPIRVTLPKDSGCFYITWDPLLRWKEVSSPYYKATYSYDSLGNLVECAFKDSLGSEKNTYQYDDLNQLISENKHTYLYDSLYNRTAKDEKTYTLNPLCQITHDGQKEYVYDPNGNLISDGTYTYEYDLLDRLISINKGGKRTNYTYDAFNRRISKNADYYIWDDKKEIGMSRWGWVRELRVLGEGLGAEIGSAVIVEINGYIYFPIHDLQGSLATLVYTNKKLYDTMRYTAFGEQLTKGYYSPWRFAGKRYDDESKLIYFGRRYYSPSLGRWITADPRGFDDGPNLYAYVRNCPLTSYDLYGLYGLPSFFSDVKHFSWGVSEGIGYNLTQVGRSFGWAHSQNEWTPTLFGDHKTYNWKNPRETSLFMLQNALPFMHDAKTLGSDVSRSTQMRARGRALGEGAVILSAAYSLFKQGWSMLRSKPASQPLQIPIELSDEYFFSGVIKSPEKKGSKRVSWLSSHPEAEGTHSTFKRDPNTNFITGYETYEFNIHTEEFVPIKRFRGIGKSHGNFNPPFILEPKQSKSLGAPPKVPREPFSWELPYGYS